MVVNRIPFQRFSAAEEGLPKRISLATTAASLTACDLTTSAAATALVLLVGGIGYRWTKRAHNEWDDTYRPFRGLTDLNALVGLQRPSVLGLLGVIVRSIPGRVRPSERKIAIEPIYAASVTLGPRDIAAEVQSLVDDRLVEEIVTVGAEQADQVWWDLVRDTAWNALGVRIARTFLLKLRTEFEAYERSLLREAENGIAMRQLLQKTDELYVLYALGYKQFSVGLNALAGRDPRFTYFISLYAGKFGDIVAAMDDTILMLSFGGVAQAPRDFTNEYLRDVFGRLRQQIANTERFINWVEGGGLVRSVGGLRSF